MRSCYTHDIPADRRERLAVILAAKGRMLLMADRSTDAVELVSAEDRLTVKAAVLFVHRRYAGNKVHGNRIRAWLTRGIKTVSGVLRLEGYFTGRDWITSEQAILRFLRELTKRRAVRAVPRTAPGKDRKKR